MSEYDIRYCKIDEVGKLVEFLRKHWKEDHVFVCNRKVLDFQHLDEENQRYNFLVAHNIKTGQFDAILGFIPTNKFDCKLETQDVWLAIWKVKKQYAKTGIGLQLLMEIMRIYKNGSVGIMGASEDAIKIYKALKYMMGELNHYYIANFNIKTQLAYFKNRHERNIQNIQNRYCIKKISKECLIDSALEYKFKPYKSIEYFINRYHNAEFYDYNFYGIYEDNLILAAFVAKIIEIKGANCMRIVDWIGEFVGDIYYPIQQLLKKDNLEYIDLVCLVPKRNHEILNMGFTLKDKNDVVPNYFEPFIKKNVIITVAWKSNDNGYAFFKGDSDQERPNFLKD